MITVTNNSPQQINAAILTLKKDVSSELNTKIEEAKSKILRDAFDGSYNSLTDKPDIPSIPDAPTENGTYNLQCTVADGTVTYVWQSV